jgi:Co/Zn/Cd efflux system component
MPIVFGGAVTITAIVSVIQHRAISNTSPWLWVGIAGVIVSIVLVAYNTPHGSHGPKKHAETETSAPAEQASGTPG